MRRRAGIVLSALLLLLVIPSPGAGASTRPAAKPPDLSGGYVLHQDLNGQGYVRSLMTLLENQTGYTDLDTIVWSRHGDQITLVFTSRQDPTEQSTYTGTLLPPRVQCSPLRIGSQRDPGTITNPAGTPATFYALNHTQTTC